MKRAFQFDPRFRLLLTGSPPSIPAALVEMIESRRTPFAQAPRIFSVSTPAARQLVTGPSDARLRRDLPNNFGEGESQ